MADEPVMKAFNIPITAVLHGRVKGRADRKGQSMRIWITRALTEVVERQEAEEAEEERRRRSR